MFRSTLYNVGHMRNELNAQFRLFYFEDCLTVHEGNVRFTTGSCLKRKPPFAKKFRTKTTSDETFTWSADQLPNRILFVTEGF